MVDIAGWYLVFCKFQFLGTNDTYIGVRLVVGKHSIIKESFDLANNEMAQLHLVAMFELGRSDIKGVSVLHLHNPSCHCLQGAPERRSFVEDLKWLFVRALFGM